MSVKYAEPATTQAVLQPLDDSPAGGSVTAHQYRTIGHGRFDQVFHCPGVNANSSVVASITEVDDRNRPFLGGADTQVLNVVPRDDEIVLLRAHVGWSSPLHLRVTLMAT